MSKKRSELRILHCVDVVNLLANALLLRVSNLAKAKHRGKAKLFRGGLDNVE